MRLTAISVERTVSLTHHGRYFSREFSNYEGVLFLSPIVTTIPTSEGLCNCLSSDTDTDGEAAQRLPQPEALASLPTAPHPV